MTDAAKHTITALELFELTASLYVDYDDLKLQQFSAEFVAMAEQERAGTLGPDWVRDCMIKMALGAIGGLYDLSEISDAAAPSLGDQTGAHDADR